MAFPMELIKKGMKKFEGKGKAPEGSAAEEATESPEFEKGEKEGSKEYKGKKPVGKGFPKKSTGFPFKKGVK